MTMTSKRVGTWILVANDKGSPSDAEWDAVLGLTRGATGSLVYTSGGVPNSAQRKRASEQGLLALRAALMTDSPIARGVVTALSWLGADTRAFDPEETQAALGFLNVPEAEHRELLSHLERMKRAVGAVA